MRGDGKRERELNWTGLCPDIAALKLLKLDRPRRDGVALAAEDALSTANLYSCNNSTTMNLLSRSPKEYF